MAIFKHSRKRRKARKTRSVPLLLFDFDGTLADTLEMGVVVFNEIAADYGLRQIGRTEVSELRKLNTRALLARLEISRMTAVKVAARMRSQFKDRITDVEVLGGVAEALARLHADGYAMAVLSSNAVKNIRRFLTHHGLSDLFQFIEGGASLFGKAERLRQVMKKEKLAAGDILYIGDETRDMEAARAAGVRSVAACWGANEEEAMLSEDPEFVVGHPADLLPTAKYARTHEQGTVAHGLRITGEAVGGN